MGRARREEPGLWRKYAEGESWSVEKWARGSFGWS